MNKKFPVFDLHCDTSNELIGAGYYPQSELFSNPCHIDLQRASRLSGYAQCFACFTTYDLAEDIETLFQQKRDAILAQVEKNSHLIRQAFSAADIEANRKEGLMSAVLTIEGPCGFGCDPDMLQTLKNQGFLIASLSWNEKNPLTGSNITGGGLTDKGRTYVREAQRLGMAIDVSHISDEGFWDIMKIAEAPVFATHSNSRALCPHPRNLTDDMFRAIAETGGVAGINLYADFLGKDATLDTVCDHVFRFLDLDPSGAHIALGGDLDGIDKTPEGFSGVEDYPALAARLLQRGLDEKTVYNIFWQNALNALQKTER